jgi:hypothetical protein
MTLFTRLLVHDKIIFGSLLFLQARPIPFQPDRAALNILKLCSSKAAG